MINGVREGALQNEIPVDQAVPIGTKLQLRATINNESGRNKIFVCINLIRGVE